MSGLVAAFPSALRADARAVVNGMPWFRLASSPGSFTVQIDGEPVVIPSRIYHAEPRASVAESLSLRQQTMLACLYTRHDDGHVRQRHLRSLGESTDLWAAPFVVQLLGEYVVQIVVDIRELFAGVNVPGSALRAVYGRFAAQNPKFVDLAHQRAISYWDRYYRSSYASRQDYPAFEVLGWLREAANET